MLVGRPVTTNRVLAGGLALLGILIVGYALLGPLVLDVIHFRTSTAGLNQIRGGASPRWPSSRQAAL